jgi:hypothetical protein
MEMEMPIAGRCSLRQFKLTLQNLPNLHAIQTR